MTHSKPRPIPRDKLTDPLEPTHRKKYPQTGYYEQMKRFSDSQTALLTQRLVLAGQVIRKATYHEDYREDIDFYINNVPISLKTPLENRTSQPVELLRCDRSNQWRASWGMTTKAKWFIWFSPDQSILLVNVKELQDYILANVFPLTNNSQGTRGKLEAQGRPSSVVNRWVTHDELYTLPSSVRIGGDLEPCTVGSYLRAARLGEQYA